MIYCRCYVNLQHNLWNICNDLIADMMESFFRQARRNEFKDLFHNLGDVIQVIDWGDFEDHLFINDLKLKLTAVLSIRKIDPIPQSIIYVNWIMNLYLLIQIIWKVDILADYRPRSVKDQNHHYNLDFFHLSSWESMFQLAEHCIRKVFLCRVWYFILKLNEIVAIPGNRIHSKQQVVALNLGALNLISIMHSDIYNA